MKVIWNSIEFNLLLLYELLRSELFLPSVDVGLAINKIGKINLGVQL
jgi:hypothetical protein